MNFPGLGFRQGDLEYARDGQAAPGAPVDQVPIGYRRACDDHDGDFFDTVIAIPQYGYVRHGEMGACKAAVLSRRDDLQKNYGFTFSSFCVFLLAYRQARSFSISSDCNRWRYGRDLLERAH